MATPLEDVGKQVRTVTKGDYTVQLLLYYIYIVQSCRLSLQIWRGAFLLADFILAQASMFKGATVLELGAGTGLTSIVMAMVAKTAYCTGGDVIEFLLLLLD